MDRRDANVWKSVVREGGDRRVRRTRAALQGALMRLMETRNYDSLTVADICAAADVGRSAFYVHFKGKDDLLRSGFVRLDADLAIAGTEDVRSLSTAFFAHALPHRLLYRAMMHSQAAPITTMQIRRILTERAMEVLPKAGPSGASRELRAQLFADLLMSVARWWLDRDPLPPVNEVDAMFVKLARGIVEAG